MRSMVEMPDVPTAHAIMARYCSGLDEEYRPMRDGEVMTETQLAELLDRLGEVRDAMLDINMAAGARVGPGEMLELERHAERRLRRLGLDEMMAKIARSYGYVVERYELDAVEEQIDRLRGLLSILRTEARLAA